MAVYSIYVPIAVPTATGLTTLIVTPLTLTLSSNAIPFLSYFQAIYVNDALPFTIVALDDVAPADMGMLMIPVIAGDPVILQ